MYSRKMFIKEGKKWIESASFDNPFDVVKSLNNDIIAKKMHKCSYIERITEYNHVVIIEGNAHLHIEVYYNNDTKSVYVVETSI